MSTERPLGVVPQKSALNLVSVEDPTTCDRCGSSLERGWSQRYRNNVLIESVCFDCDDLERVEEYLKTGILTTKLVTRAAIEAVHKKYGNSTKIAEDLLQKLQASSGTVTSHIKNWEQVVWFSGLQAAVRKASFRGFQLKFEGGHALVYSLAGRTQVTLETDNEEAQVSLITIEDSLDPVMGLNSIRATEQQAVELLTRSRSSFTSGNKFIRDDKVGI